MLKFLGLQSTLAGRGPRYTAKNTPCNRSHRKGLLGMVWKAYKEAASEGEWKVKKGGPWRHWLLLRGIAHVYRENKQLNGIVEMCQILAVGVDPVAEGELRSGAF